MSALLVLLAAAPAIDAVVVYPDRAQVARATDVDCGARKAVTFSGLSPAAAMDSFRAAVEGGTVDGLRVERNVRADAFTPQMNDLKTKWRALDREQEALHDERERAVAKATLGQRLQDVAAAQVARELAADKPDPKAWTTAFDAALTARAQGNAAVAEADAKQRDLDRRRAELQKKIDALGWASQREELTADVVVTCPAGRRARVELTYLVGGASWTPSYEARADEGGGTVELSVFATLRQQTGEAWENAKLTLSTAVPAQNATPPELKRLKVSATERAPEKKVLTRRDEAVEVAVASGSSASQSPNRLAVRAQGLSVQLEVPQRSTVPGDGSEQRLFVARHKLKASFAYRTAPRLQPYVFRVAELVNTAPFPLLEGALSAFRSTGLIARYRLERVPEGAVFKLTFGIEDSMRVKRVVLEEVKRDAGLFNTKKRFSYAYRFELQNFGKGPAELELWEGLPVSEVDDVAVVVANEKTTSGYKLDPNDGIAKWKVKLAQAEQKNVELMYKVEVPNDYDMGGL